jgi:phage recombination protein Bet
MQQSQNNSLVAMPPLAGFFTEQHFRALILPEKDRRMELDLNWLSLQTREHPELQAADFIDFINQCQLTGADPRRKQAHLVTFKKKIKVYDPQQNKQVDQWVTKASTIFSYHFFITKAQETGEMQGLKIEDGIGDYANPNTKQIFKENFCKVTVTRKGCPYEFTAWYPEFVKVKKDFTTGVETVTEMWLKMPKMMLQKCAIANALRLAFSEALVGMYISEEMHGEESLVPPKDVSALPQAPTTGQIGRDALKFFTDNATPIVVGAAVIVTMVYVGPVIRRAFSGESVLPPEYGPREAFYHRRRIF